MRITDIAKEIKNYYYVKSVIRKHKNSPEWKKHKLSVGWFGVIYTVINLPPEAFESEEQYYSVYVMEQMMPINTYLENINLHEVVVPRVENLVRREEGIFAYGVKYIPLFRELTFRYVISRLMFATLIVWAQYRFSAFTTAGAFVWKYIKAFFEWAI